MSNSPAFVTWRHCSLPVDRQDRILSWRDFLKIIYTGLANRSAVVANNFAEILSGPCTLSVLSDFNTCTSVKCRSVNSSCSPGWKVLLPMQWNVRLIVIPKQSTCWIHWLHWKYTSYGLSNNTSWSVTKAAGADAQLGFTSYIGKKTISYRPWCFHIFLGPYPMSARSLPRCIQVSGFLNSLVCLTVMHNVAKVRCEYWPVRPVTVWEKFMITRNSAVANTSRSASL